MLSWFVLNFSRYNIHKIQNVISVVCYDQSIIECSSAQCAELNSKSKSVTRYPLQIYRGAMTMHSGTVAYSQARPSQSFFKFIEFDNANCIFLSHFTKKKINLFWMQLSRQLSIYSQNTCNCFKSFTHPIETQHIHVYLLCRLEEFLDILQFAWYSRIFTLIAYRKIIFT